MNIRENDFIQMRKDMVINQLSGRDIKDKRVLDAFRNVPRHRFMDQKLQGDAYSDFPLPIGEGQTISQPYITALMTQFLDIKKSDTVLEIGTGSGYQTAILAELAGKVFSIERIKKLTDASSVVLKELGYGNITLKTGDGTLGWEEFAPFNKIIVSAASSSVPDPLVSQLRSPGALVMPVGSRFNQALLVLEKTFYGEIIKNKGCDCSFVPLIGKYAWPEDK